MHACMDTHVSLMQLAELREKLGEMDASLAKAYIYIYMYYISVIYIVYCICMHV